jgi:hypothetical protein
MGFVGYARSAAMERSIPQKKPARTINRTHLDFIPSSLL